MCFPVWYMYSSAMYYGPGGTSLEKKVEYPSLRVSPEVNCNQFTFHTITLSSVGAREVSVLNRAAAGRQVCQFLFSPDLKKSKFQQQIRKSESLISVFSEKKNSGVINHISIFLTYPDSSRNKQTFTERLATTKLSFQIISF